HKKKDHRAVDFIAGTEVDRRLVLGRMERALGIEFHIKLEFWSEIVADDEASDPAVRSFVDELIADLIVDIDWAEFLGKFEGQEEGLARGRDTAAHGIVRIVEKELRENRDGEARPPSVVETPLDSGIGLTEAKLSRGRRI